MSGWLICASSTPGGGRGWNPARYLWPLSSSSRGVEVVHHTQHGLPLPHPPQLQHTDGRNDVTITRKRSNLAAIISYFCYVIGA